MQDSSGCCVFTMHWWKMPLVSSRVYFRVATGAGYGLTLLCFVSVVLFLGKGHSCRPQILDDGLIQRILHLAGDETVALIAIGSRKPLQALQTPDGKEWLVFPYGERQVSGLAIPMNRLHLGEDVRNIGLCLLCAYLGSPTLHFGFTLSLPAEPIQNWEEFATNHTIVSQEIPPNPGRPERVVIMAPTYIDTAQFEVSIREAGYFILCFTSPESGKLYLENLILLEEP